jgi:beta-fructofuranosidase
MWNMQKNSEKNIGSKREYSSKKKRERVSNMLEDTLHGNKINQAQRKIEEKLPEMKKAKMRQRYHFMGQEGWINDPNGLIFYKGRYHFFFQCNPYGSYWDTIYWGHAVSDDLLHWEYLPIALAPSAPYEDGERGGCFSGSAIEFDGKLFLIYTGTTKTEEGFIQSQCIAYSTDGIHFEKYAKNPVISAPEGIEQDNFRDPKVWKYEDDFYLVCGGKQNNLAKALLYKSKNLTDWEFVNVMFESRGEYGYMFECPDFFSLDGRDILTFCPMGAGERTAVYLVGKLNYDTGKFYPVCSGEADWGFDYYAPQSFQDAKGRRIVTAWANAWEWMPWWKDWGPTYQEGWCGFFNIPREVRLMPDDSLQFVPVEELAGIRYGEKTVYGLETEETLEFHAGDGISAEMKFVLDLEKTTARRLEFIFRGNEEKGIVLTLDLSRDEMSLDRNQADGWSKGKTKSVLLTEGRKELDLHILLDMSSVEVFSCQYRINHSCNAFADETQNRNLLRVKGGKAYFKSIFTCGLKKTMDL